MKKTIPTKKIAALALFTAFSFIFSFWSFPIFPATPYLKLDFGNVFIMLSGFLFGPIEAIGVTLAKELLALTVTTSGGVGEIANFLMTSSFVILPSVIYKYRKGLKTVALSLCGACLIGTGASALVNRFIVFPLYMDDTAAKVFGSVFWFVIGFNVIKTVSVSVATVLIYKRLSNFLTKFSVK